MKQAVTSFWLAGDGGGDVFVKIGTVLPDDHPEVKRAPDNFADIAIEETPAAAPKKARAARTAAGKGDAPVGT